MFENHFEIFFGHGSEHNNSRAREDEQGRFIILIKGEFCDLLVPKSSRNFFTMLSREKDLTSSSIFSEKSEPNELLADWRYIYSLTFTVAIETKMGEFLGNPSTESFR